MAYSDYGGYAYRNGERVESRSDAVISPDGIKSTPGAWPGWTLPEGRDGSAYHVVLGDGLLQRYEETIDDHKIEAVFDYTDNYYAYVRLTQPDGVVWTGFSGYGVGAGLESGDHGFSTQACVDRLHELFAE